jgi:signal transduction histidine kinase
MTDVTDTIDPNSVALDAQSNEDIAASVTTAPTQRRGGFVAAFISARFARLARSFARSNRQTAMRRIPLFAAVMVAALTAPLFSILTNRLIDARRDRLWQEVIKSGQHRTIRAESMLSGGEQFEDGLIFVVKPETKETRSLGPTDIEPPLFQLVQEAENGPAEQWFQQRGRALQTFTRRFNADTFLVVIEDVSWVDGDVRRISREARRWSFAWWLFISALTGLLAHLLLRPARRVIRERIDFLADAAHELRTPLSVIQASAGHALSRERETVDYVQSLVEIRSAAERASAGVSELLDLARFDAGQAVPRLAPLRLDLLAEEIVSSTRVDDCTLVAETSPTVLVQADMALLRQAVDNLVRNAAARSSQVVLRCRADSSDGIIEVHDDGPGFPAAQLPYVFERYRRGDGRGSLGLGLPIAASIVAAHGGTVTIASPSPQRLSPDHPGSVVTVRLPRSRN